MKMQIAHTGRTGKDTSITFDTDRNIFCFGHEAHNVFIYAELTRDVNGVIWDLKRLGYRQVTVEEFRGEAKATTRKEMKLLRDGDKFYVNGEHHVAVGHSHLSDDASCDEYIVYDENGESWFEKDFPYVA